jgi:hypothetical protein
VLFRRSGCVGTDTHLGTLTLQLVVQCLFMDEAWPIYYTPELKISTRVNTVGVPQEARLLEVLYGTAANNSYQREQGHLRCSDRSRSAKCRDAPIDIRQIGPVTMPIQVICRLLSLLHPPTPPSPLLFSAAQVGQVSFLEKFGFNRTFCLALRASVSLRPQKGITARRREDSEPPTSPCALPGSSCSPLA